MADATGTLEKLANLLGQALVTLQARLARDSAAGYFAQIGTVFPDGLGTDPDVGPKLDTAAGAAGGIATGLNDLAAAQDALDIVAAGAAIVGQFETLLGALDALAAAIDAKATSWAPLTEAEVHAFTANFANRVFEDCLLRFLEIERPEFVAAAVIVGVVDRFRVPVAGATGVAPVLVRQLQLSRLSAALASPVDYLKGLFGWGDSFDLDKFLLRFQAFLDLFGSSTSIDTSSGEPVLLGPGVTVKKNSTASPTGVDLIFELGIPDGFSFSVPVRPGYDVILSAAGNLPDGVTLTARPPSQLSVASPVTVTLTSALSRTPFGDEEAVVILGQTGATRLQADAITFSTGLKLTADPGNTTASGDLFVSFDFQGAKGVIDFGEGDGFISQLTSGKPVEAPFELGASWSVADGFRLRFGGSLALRLNLHLDLGPIQVPSIYISLGFQDGKFPLELSAEIHATLGPISVAVDRVGVLLDLSFPAAPARGNLGPADLDAHFKPPSGAGLSIDAGAVHGGGFLTFEDHRYSGVLELSVFAVTVKAFGLIETQLPDGTPGFSFVIIIIAEFTPIQLGFGFTLLGVGGLLGVNRSVNEQGLSDAVRTGSLEHVLFPHDPVHDAPAIIHDLATLFPAAKGHFIFGPMAKLGWGTPTLITADLGIVIEFPGPRIAVLGILRMLLPDPKEAIVALNMAVAGLLDFPAKKFSLDASLFDSTVAGYAVTGDMAFRLEYGDNKKFLLGIGGFNSGFSPPAPFPDLRRVSVDFGVNGNPSLTASGYFALTSNTAQIGSSIQLHASGYGITVDGWMGFDVMFVFSPFSLNASISAGMRASFHGHGLGITLHGTLTGPTPWHLNGKVCVSILWWDACLPIDVTFGDGQPASLPEMDPWTGDPSVPVVGLQAAIADPRNWEGTGTPAEVTVVSLAASDRTPIDPLGSATLRQKVAPFNRKLEKFGEFKPTGHDQFKLGPSGGTVGVVVPGQPPVPVTELKVVQDDFAPGHFMKLSNAQKLSMPSYVSMDAGVSVAADRISLGSSDPVTIAYVTKFIDDDGVVHEDDKLTLTDAQLRGMLKRSPSALGGVRRTGTERFMLADRPKKIRLGPPLFVVADACTMVRNSTVTGAPISQAEAVLALREHLRTNPQDADRFTVVPQYAEAA